jgi:lipopolysaccharide transport protein LptA
MTALVTAICLLMVSPTYAEATDHAGTSKKMIPATTGSAPQAKTAKPVAADKISIASDGALINRAKHTILLRGNVVVHQGDTTITSDSLTLFLKPGAKMGPPGVQSENSINKIIADGNVVFKLDSGTAYSDHAEYTTKSRVLVLTGKAPKFISRDNTITGSRITVNRNSGLITFAGGKGRVQAVIYSKDRL